MEDEKLVEINLSEKEFAQPTEFDFKPAVYFRLTRKLKEGTQLPLIDYDRLFEIDPNFKFRFETYSTFLTTQNP